MYTILKKIKRLGFSNFCIAGCFFLLVLMGAICVNFDVNDTEVFSSYFSETNQNEFGKQLLSVIITFKLSKIKITTKKIISFYF